LVKEYVYFLVIGNKDSAQWNKECQALTIKNVMAITHF